MKLLLKKIRGLLERARKWNAHEDGAGGVYERAVLEAVERFLRVGAGLSRAPHPWSLRVRVFSYFPLSSPLHPSHFSARSNANSCCTRAFERKRNSL